MIKRGSAGDYDDDQFADDEQLYRRVPDKPSHLKVVDPVTGKKRPTTAAFRIADEPDGLSISIRGLLVRHGLKTFDLCKDWSTHGVARFAARHVRSETGVIENPTDDPLVGRAHGLIRGPDGIPTPSVWNKVRDRILGNLDYFESDPEPASDSPAEEVPVENN
ncbi:hypothetical protein [Mycobacterium sp. ENV421]|uniref:hypothetical protein n=1 Tax=Mycobacterium sp. ENV421 TaxID=1213407 RepID=UPI00115A6458|nr:hypothetical protein [Mycobacterium sp. ENV421]